MSTNGDGRPKLTYADYEYLREQHRKLEDRCASLEAKLADLPTKRQAQDALGENAELRRMNEILLQRNTILNRKLKEHGING